MNKPQKKRFHFDDKAPMTMGSDAKDVRPLQTLLAAYGYLRGGYIPDHFCPVTRRAVRRYQRFYGLKPDGIVGPVTKRHMERPRCGVADIPVMPAMAVAGAPFVLRGCSYPRRDLSYTFLNDTPDLPGGRDQDIVRQAFQSWQEVADLRFTEVGRNANADFRVAWRRGDHGDGNPFDELGGPGGNTLAHAFFPPPCGGPTAGDLHFDEAETWIDDPAGRGILLLQVAIHEIGHLLGLSHSNDESAIMFAFYAPDRVNLAQDDINGIRALYGAPQQAPAVRRLTLADGASGSLAGRGATASFEVEVPAALAIVLDGPEGADFDLYVRRNAPATRQEWDFRAFSASADERLIIPAEAGVRYFVLVDSFSGAGNYTLRVEPA